ncbi:MAG: acylphosphatase [Treponema sp.]|nr:acylphosphatase [Treponema sp.]
MGKMSYTAFYARVIGRVQGVGFRYSAAREAERLKVKGRVSNAANGDVEVWAEGSPGSCELFLKWLNKGPQFSRVDSVEVEIIEPKGYDSFSVGY